jgi:putative Holliday junction resolvase
MIGRVLAVDYGAKRTGLAVSDAMGITAQPLEAIREPGLDETLDAILAAVAERDVKTVVVGMPYLPDGREGEQVKSVWVFLDALKRRLPAGVALAHQDERHTTKEARGLLAEAGLRGRKAKEKVDSVAAVVILREYLDTEGAAATRL